MRVNANHAAGKSLFINEFDMIFLFFDVAGFQRAAFELFVPPVFVSLVYCRGVNGLQQLRCGPILLA